LSSNVAAFGRERARHNLLIFSNLAEHFARHAEDMRDCGAPLLHNLDAKLNCGTAPARATSAPDLRAVHALRFSVTETLC
jgi:hypothetical protein